MTPPLFRVDIVPSEGSELVLEGPEGRHAGSALRLAPGEMLRAGDGRGTVADCEVTAVASGCVTSTVKRLVTVPPSRPRVTVVQALPKSDRSELAVELATEAGVDRIVPWQAERCVSRWNGPKLAKGHAKWQSAARAAAKQSRRAYEPQILAPSSTADLVSFVREIVDGGGLVCILHEGASEPLAEVVSPWWAAAGDDEPRELIFVVGPEGGVSDAEIDVLRENGARAVVLGPEVLRTSTAAAVALGAFSVLTGRWAAGASTLSHTGGRTDQPGSDCSK